MDILRIEWNDRSKGFMELNVDKFFPCTADKATKVFKLVARWCSDETIAELDSYLHTQKDKASEQMKSDVKDYGNARQRVSDLQTIIADGRHPNGVKVTTVELLQLKDDLKEAKRQKCTLYNSAKHLKTKVERYNRNIELLHTHTNERK